MVELEFTSERARASVVFQAPDGTIRLMCKGSDAVMLPRIRDGSDPALLAETDRNLYAFSVKGLRTLVLATKARTARHERPPLLLSRVMHRTPCMRTWSTLTDL